MAQLTVRNLDPELVRALRIRAAHNNRSAEAEHRLILDAALGSGAVAFAERAAALRAETRGRAVVTDSTALVREDRDRDHQDFGS